MRKFLLGAPSVVTARGAEVEKRAERAAVVARAGIRAVEGIKPAWERASADRTRVGGIVKVLWGGGGVRSGVAAHWRLCEVK